MYRYDPYGQVTPGGSNSVANPWQYTGGYLDSQTGLVKLGQRYYDPTLGRFTQLDPLGGGYAYASDNPVNFIDPTGLDGFLVTGAPDITTGNTSQGGLLSFDFAKKPDIRYIDYVADRYGLTDDERRALHDAITGQNLSHDEIESLADQIRRERDINNPPGPSPDTPPGAP